MSASSNGGRQGSGELEPGARQELAPGATLERAVDFATRWLTCGGDTIALGDFYADGGCEPLKFVRLPAWAEAVGAVLAPGGGRALIWVMPKVLADEEQGSPFAPLSASMSVSPATADNGVLQLAIRRPKSWERGPVLVRYAGIVGTHRSVRGARKAEYAHGQGQFLSGAEQRFTGLERASGETLVLTLPARGESLIIIVEIK